MLAALGLRALSHLQLLPAHVGNLSPLVAFAFAGSIVFPRTLPWWSWAVLLLGFDWIVLGSMMWQHSHGHLEVLTLYVCYALAAFTGSRLRGRIGIIDTLLGTFACSVLFYLVTNTLSWWIDPGYAQKSTATWVQALTTGLPGYPSTISFFRNSLLADLSGALVLMLAYNAEALLRQLQHMPLFGDKLRPAEVH